MINNNADNLLDVEMQFTWKIVETVDDTSSKVGSLISAPIYSLNAEYNLKRQHQLLWHFG